MKSVLNQFLRLSKNKFGVSLFALVISIALEYWLLSGLTFYVVASLTTCFIFRFQIQKTVKQDMDKKQLHCQNILNSLPIVIFKAKPNGAWDFVNNEWFHLTGHHLKSNNDDSWKEAIVPSDRDILNEELEIAQFRQVGFSRDVRLASTSNDLIWVNISLKALFSENQTFDGFIGTIENRTEKKKIEALLSASQKIDRFLASDPPYREILKPSLVLISQSFEIQFAAFWDIDTQEQKLRLVHHWMPNNNFASDFLEQCKSLFFDKDQGLPGRAWTSLAPVSMVDVSSDDQFLRKSPAAKAGFHGAIAIPIAVDDQFLGVMEFYSAYKLIFTASDLEEFRGFATRIGQVLIKKKAEEELSQVKQYIEQQTAAINTFAIISIADTDGTMTYVNDNFVSVSQYSREEILGKDHHFLASGYHDEEFLARIWETINRGETWKGEICNKAKDGNLYWLDSTIVPFFNATGVITQFVAIYSNITDRKQVERRLIDSAKMSSLGEMAGGIAHEINNPLTIIAGMAETISRTLQRQPLDMKRLEKSSARIQSTVERISKIIKGLNTFARDSSGDDFDYFPLSRMLEETIEFCAPRFQEYGISIHREPPPTSLTLKCRPVEIEQVILNLLNNAFDAVLRLEERWISISTEIHSAEDLIQIKITDSGSGIPESIQEKMFNPFFTTKKMGQGTGLGLSLSQGIVTHHGGSLYVDRTSPNTCFIIEFNLTENQKLNKAS